MNTSRQHHCESVMEDRAEITSKDNTIRLFQSANSRTNFAAQ